MPLNSLIVGIDLVPIKPIRGVIGITEDITTEKCRQAIKKARHSFHNYQIIVIFPSVSSRWAQSVNLSICYFFMKDFTRIKYARFITKCSSICPQVMPSKDALFDVVICDGAPNVGGAWSREAYTQAALILDACKLATEFLAPRGMFITKVFRSSEYHALLYSFQQLFDRVESTKPMASRSTSAEIYVVCKGYKAPAKIDKRLLDPSCLFAEARKTTSH